MQAVSVRPAKRGKLLVAGCLFIVAVIATTGAANARTCADFATQAEAQAWFESRGGSATNNVDGLDEDNDGIPCEHLPLGTVADSGWFNRVGIPLVAAAVLVAGGAGLFYVMRSQRRAIPAAPPSVSPAPVVALEPPAPADPGPWPETSPERQRTFTAMDESGPASYLASPEWHDKERWKGISVGHRCELCGTAALLTLHHRSREHLYREQPADVILLCASCAATMT